MNLTKGYDCMKRLSKVLVIVLFIAGILLSFFVGSYMSNKEHQKERIQNCHKHISLAIDTVEEKGLALEGASEAIASNLWVAHESCDNPELLAELSNLWNILVYEKGTYIGEEEVLVTQLHDILERCQ